MRLFSLTTFLFLLLLACKSKGGSGKFIINGKIENATITKVYLEEIPLTTMTQTVVDSAVPAKDGSFKLKAVSSEQRIYNLRFAGSEYPALSLINDESEVSVKIFFDAKQPAVNFPDHFKIEGSSASNNLLNYMLRFNTQMESIFADAQKLDSIQKANNMDLSFESYQRSIVRKGSAVKTFTDSLFNKKESPALSMMVLSYYQSMAGNPMLGLQPYATEDVVSIVNDLAKKFPKHNGIAVIKTQLSAPPTAAAGSFIGKEAPDFTLPDVNGKMISLSSFRGKYVLVDFWASWCAPCRGENPNVVKAFTKYKDKNFTILGVSLDEKKGDWGKAVMKDGLTWTQVSDLKGWSSSVVPLYNIQGIPFNVLVDPQGKVIAESLRGPELESTLAKVLK
jgi:peroxiredoxin